MNKKIDFALTKMSSKGQIVIPAEMREDLKEGEKFLIIKQDNTLVLQRMGKLPKKFEEDLIFARRTEEALEKYDKGEFKSMKAKDFLEEIKKW